MTKPLNVGVIGLGWPGRGHLQGYAETEQVNIVALCDLNQKLLDEQAALHGVKQVFTDPGQMLKDADLDAVSVCLPNFLHHPVSRDALRAGKHVFCEKPPTLNAAEAIELARLARENKVHMMYAFCTRFSPQANYVRQLVDQGDLGEIYFGKAVYSRRSGIPIGAGGWFVDKKRAGGGALLDIGVHPLDCVWWLMGTPQPVTVMGAAYQKFRDTVPADVNFDVDDSAFAIIRFANDATLMLECSWALHRAGNNGREIAGTRGGACLDPLKIFTRYNGRQADITPDLPNENMVTNEVRHFVRCIRDGEAPIPSADQGVTLMKMIDAIYASAQSGREVRIPPDGE